LKQVTLQHHPQPIDYILTDVLSWWSLSPHHHGFILYTAQGGHKCYPSCFGSITWNERDLATPQAKIEIYGLCMPYKHIALHYQCPKSWSRINTSYIKGMLNNPDIQLEPWSIGGLLVSSLPV